MPNEIYEAIVGTPVEKMEIQIEEEPVSESLFAHEEHHLKQAADTYFKDDLRGFALSTFIQAVLPIAFWNEIDKYYYRAHYSEERSMIQSENKSRDPYWNKELEAWLMVSAIYGAVHGSMFIFSGFGLSEVMGSVAAGFMEVVYSNVYIPAAFYSGYIIWQGIVADGQTSTATYRLYGFGLVALFFVSTIFGGATNAMYYMNKADSPYADDSLWPAIFYWINWLDHTPRE